MVKKKQDNPLAGLTRFNVDPIHVPEANKILGMQHRISAQEHDASIKKLRTELAETEAKKKKPKYTKEEIMGGSLDANYLLKKQWNARADYLEKGMVTPFQWATYSVDRKGPLNHKGEPVQPGEYSDDYYSYGIDVGDEAPVLPYQPFGVNKDLPDWVGNDVIYRGLIASRHKNIDLDPKTIKDMYETSKTGKVSESALPKTSEKPVASKKKTKNGKGWMEIVSGPGAGTYKMPEEEKEARAAAKAGRETLKAESKGKRKDGYETTSATEITKINEARKEASKKAGVWRESSYPNPIGVKSSKETPAVSAPTTEKSTPVATSKPTKKKESKPKSEDASSNVSSNISKSKKEEPKKDYKKKEEKPKQDPYPKPQQYPSNISKPEKEEKPKKTGGNTARRVTEDTAKQDETPAAPSNPMVLDDGGMPKGGSKKSKNKFILNTDKSGKGKPQYGNINRARDIAAGKEQGLAASSAQAAPAESSDGEKNKFIVGGGKSGVPARYGTMDEARAFAEQERTRQDRIGNGSVRAFDPASAPAGGPKGESTFYDFSDEDLGISKPSAGKKPGLIERIKGKVRGGKKDGVTSPSGATSTPPAPPTPPGTASGGAGAPPPPPPDGGGKGGFAPPSTPPVGGRGEAFGAGHGGPIFAPQTQQTARGGGIVMGNQGSQNQIYAPGASGGFSNIGNNTMSPGSGGGAPVVASTGGDARSTNKNATVLSTGGNAVQSHPRAANANSTGRRTTKRS